MLRGPRLRAGLMSLALAAATLASAAETQAQLGAAPPKITIGSVTFSEESRDPAPSDTTKAGFGSSTVPVRVRIPWSVQASPQTIIQEFQVDLEMGLGDGSTKGIRSIVRDGSQRSDTLTLDRPADQVFKTFKVAIRAVFLTPTTTAPVEQTGTVPRLTRSRATE